MQLPAPGKHEPHQGKAPLERADRPRPAGPCEALIGRALGAEDDGGVLVGIAERADGGQKRRPSA